MPQKDWLKWIYRTLEWLFFGCFVLCAAALAWSSGIFWAGLLVLGCYGIFSGRIRIPGFTLWLFVLAFVCHFLWTSVAGTRIQSDFSLMYRSAQSMLNGDLSFASTQYFVLWSYQLAFVSLEAALLWGWNDPMCIQIFNCLCSAGAVCLIYRLIRPQVREAVARTTAVCVMVFPTIAAMSSLLTNQCSGAFFLILGLWLLVSEDVNRLGFARYPLAGLAVQIGNLLRPEGIIVMVAVAAYAVFRIIRGKVPLKRMICGFAVFVLVYGAAGSAADQIAVHTGLTPYGFGNQLPQWKFVCGTNFDTAGGYAGADFEALQATLDENYMPTEETDALVKQILSQRLKQLPERGWDFLTRKLERLWTKAGTGWALAAADQDAPWFNKNIRPIAESFDRCLFWMALLLSCFGLLKKRKEPEFYLPYFVFFAAFAAFLLIEVQPRYAYFPDYFLLAAGANGLERIADLLERKPES